MEKIKRLLKNDWAESYIEYIENESGLKDKKFQSEFLKLLKEKDEDERLKKWASLKIKITDISEISKLSNPYFIGFGEPESDILFIGQEKAFSPNSTDSLFNESINNIYHWKKIAHENPNRLNGFDPRFPVEFYKEPKHSDTWAKYDVIMKELTYKKKIKRKDAINDNTHFANCFMTELNHIPAKRSRKVELNSNRLEFLKNDFFKSFKLTIIGARTYLNRHKTDLMSEIFDSNFDKEKIIFELGTSKRKVPIKIYKGENRYLVVTNQLSGAAGWNKPELMKNFIAELEPLL